MSNPRYQKGSIFGMNHPTPIRPQTPSNVKPQAPGSGGIFGQQSALFNKNQTQPPSKSKPKLNKKKEASNEIGSIFGKSICVRHIYIIRTYRFIHLSNNMR